MNQITTEIVGDQPVAHPLSSTSDAIGGDHMHLGASVSPKSMNPADLIHLVFDGEAGKVVTFDMETDQDVEIDLSDLDGIPASAGLVMEKDGKVFGVVVGDKIPPTFQTTHKSVVYNVILLEKPASIADLPTDVRFDVPLTDAIEVSGQFMTLEALNEADNWDVTPTAAPVEVSADEPFDGVEEDLPPQEPEFLNDALLLGVETPAFGEFLAKPVTFLTGEMWGTKDRRNTQDKDWKTNSMPWGAWVFGADAKGKAPAWGLSRHPEDKNKAGTSIVLGSSIGGARKANAMDEMFALGLDIDSGAKLDDVITKIEELDLFTLIYTSHSHGKIGMEIKRDELLRKLQISRDPTLLEVQEFLRTHSKSRYEESFIEKIKIEDPQHQTTEGVKIVLSTPPLDKFRIIFPLEEPVKLIDLAPTQSEALDIWADKITGMAWEKLGIHFDTSCTDPSRLFYGPRHAKDAEWDSMYPSG